jgi:hypothetical protein
VGLVAAFITARASSSSLARLLWPNPNGKRKEKRSSLFLVSEFVAYSIEVGATQFFPRFHRFSQSSRDIRLAGLWNNRIKSGNTNQIKMLIKIR